LAKSDSKGPGNSGKARPQVQPSLPSEKPAATASESNRGDTGAARNRSSPTELPPQFGRYRVKKKLGGGGMGTVYLVENTQLDREEALKVPHFGDGDDTKSRERFLREARSAAKLDHPNLCPVYDVGVQDGIHYLTMRFLKGKLLSEYTDEAQPVRKAVEIVAKLAQALEAAHAKGVIHRDLKPSNVMMVGGVGPVVMDFGLAKQVRQPDQKLTQAGSMLGTPSYMPPEQVNGDLEQMGPASDVYSLGVILYELLTGHLPFEGSTAAVFGQILYAERPVPSSVRPGLEPTLDEICRKAMAKALTDRYASMKVFAGALMDYLRSTPAMDTAPNLVPDTSRKAALSRVETPNPAMSAHATLPPEAARTLRVAPVLSWQRRRSLPPWLVWAFGGGLLLVAGLVLAIIILRVETKAGTVLLEIDQKDVEVSLDGDKITIGRPGDKDAITVEAKEGKHLLRVTKPGFEAWTDDITFRDKDPHRVKISLKPVAAAQTVDLDRKVEPTKLVNSKSDDRFLPLFNGKDLSGWRPVNSQVINWSVDRGVLVGRGKGPGGGQNIGHLVTEGNDYANFHLRAELVPGEPSSSALRFRVGPGGNFEDIAKGYGVHIVGTDQATTDAVQLNTGDLRLPGVASITDKILGKAPKLAQESGRWFTLEVIAIGNQFSVRVDGLKMVDCQDPEDSFSVGRIGLYCRPNSVVKFRKIEIQKLPARETRTAKDNFKEKAPLQGSSKTQTVVSEPIPKTFNYQNDPLGMKFVKLPKGTFWMGKDGKNAQVQATIAEDFELAAYTVSQAQWQEVMGANPSWFSRQGGGKEIVKGVNDEDLSRFPVENVSWNDVKEFLEVLNARESGRGWFYRLPTEAEWEYGCRRGATSQAECSYDYYFQQRTNDLSSHQANFNGNFPGGKGLKGPYLGRTERIGSYAPNKLGLYDMHGNVWQWCSDLFDGAGSARVIRGGGSFGTGQGCRAANRGRDAPANNWNGRVGFRLARVPSDGK
jgi:serine/threonine protein kinase/formylglycine-generating enzyme required for sulfatase activity